MRNKQVLFSFCFALLTIFLLIVVSSRYSERGNALYATPDAQLQPYVSEPPSATPDVPDPPETPSTRPADEKPDIDISSWEYILANDGKSIGYYTPPQTVPIEGTAHYFDSRALDALNDFIQGATDAGFTPYIMAAYRTYSAQEYILNGKASQLAWPDYPTEEDVEQARTIVAYPGTSDHQTGLAVDITDKLYSKMDAAQMDQELLSWLSEHCAEYGFILRYPSNKVLITGWDEAWHFRYVGKVAAKYIMENNLCLEQFLELYK